MAITYDSLLAYINGLNADGSLSDADYNQIILYILAQGNLANSPRDLMQIRRGNFANLPNLAQGEFGFCLDTEQLFIGGMNGNVPLQSAKNLGVNIQSFGAKLDGVTDDTAAFNAAKAVSNKIIIPYTVGGCLLNDVTIDKELTVLGEGKLKPKIIAKSTVSKLFTIASNKVVIQNFYIDMDAAGVNSICIYFETATVGREQFYLRDVWIYNAYAAVRDANGAGLLVHIYFQNSGCVFGKGLQVWLRDTFGFLNFEDFLVDYTQTKTNHNIDVTFAGIKIENNLGCNLRNVDVLGGTASTGGDGFVFVNCQAVSIVRALADTLGGIGFNFNNCLHLYLNDVSAGLCSHGGFVFDHVTYSQAVLLKVVGAVALSNSPSATPGVLIKNGSGYFQLTNLQLSNNTGDGLDLTDSTNTIVQNIQSLTNTGKGFAETGTSNFNMISLGACASNTAGNYTTLGAGTLVDNMMLSSGSVINDSTGAHSY